MTHIVEGELPLKHSSRARQRSIRFMVLLTFALLLSACGIQADTNWPGMTAVGDTVYVSYGPEVVAVDIPEQQLLWRFPDEPGAAQYLAAPSIRDDLVVIGDYGVSKGFLTPGVLTTVYAFSESDATIAGSPTRWESAGIADDRIIAPVLQTDNAVFVGTADNRVVAVDRATGEKRWDTSEIEGVNIGNAVWSQPSYSDGLVIVTSMDRSVYALDEETGDLVWQVPLSGAISAKPVVDDGVAYVGSYDGQVHALDAATGDELWVADASNWIWGAPALSTDRVFYADNSGKVYAADRESGEIIWEADVGRPVIARTLLANDVLYVAAARTERTEEAGEIVAFSAEDGTTLWRVETSTPIFSDPAIVEDGLVVLIQGEDGTVLNVYELENGVQRWSFPLQVAE